MSFCDLSRASEDALEDVLDDVNNDLNIFGSNSEDDYRALAKYDACIFSFIKGWGNLYE